MTPQGNDCTQVISGYSTSINELSNRINYAITTSLAARAFVQWNNEDDEVNLNLRLSFLPSGGSTFFLVYNCLWEQGKSDWRVMDRALLLKVVYLLKI